MSDFWKAAQQAMEALDGLSEDAVCQSSHHAKKDRHTSLDVCPVFLRVRAAITTLRAALAELEQEPGDFDHNVGADRFKVVRGAFWWHVLIGDSPTEHGKFRSRAGAEKMAADLLREFRNGAFVQWADYCPLAGEPCQSMCEQPCSAHRLKINPQPAEPGRGPVAKVKLMTTGGNAGLATRIVEIDDHLRERLRPGQLLYTAPPQRQPLTDDAYRQLMKHAHRLANDGHGELAQYLRDAIDIAHGIGSKDE